MSLAVGPSPRLLVPVSIVIDRLFSRQVVVGIVFVGFHAVVDADCRHGHHVDNQAAQRYPVIAVADTEVSLVYFGAVDAVTGNHKGEVLDARIVER